MARVFNSVKEIFEGMAGVFNQSAAAGLNVVIQYDIEGDQGETGMW